MILPIHRVLRMRIAETVTRLYGIPADDPILAAIPVEPAPRRALGDRAEPRDRRARAGCGKRRG